MATLVINSADIAIRGFAIKQELQSNHPLDVKVKKVAWQSLVIAIDGTLILADPAGLSLLANAEKVTTVATHLSALASMGEGFVAARKIVSSRAQPTCAKVIAYCQILCQVSYLTGTISQAFPLPKAIKVVTDSLPEPSYQLGRLANEVQTIYQKHGQKIYGLYCRLKVRVNAVCHRVFGITLFSFSPERQALQATDALMEHEAGRTKLQEYLTHNFFPLPHIYRDWYRHLYKNEQGLLSAKSKQPVITPCRKREENGEISARLYDFDELNVDPKDLGEISDNRVVAQGNGKVFLDKTICAYIYTHALAPLRRMVKEKLEAYQRQQQARAR